MWKQEWRSEPPSWQVLSIPRSGPCVFSQNTRKNTELHHTCKITTSDPRALPMNFLFKSISGFQFPYSLESTPSVTTPIWEATNGHRKSDSLPVTVFSFQKQRNGALDAMIANAVHYAKVLKLPGILRVVDVLDTNQNTAYVVTERAHILDTKGLSQHALSLGTLQVAETLELLHAQAKVVLGTLSRGTVFVNERGEWRLFGLELCSKISDLSHMKQNVSSYLSFVAGSGLEVQISPSSAADAVLLSKFIQSIYSHPPSEWKPLLVGLEQGRLTLSQFLARSKNTQPFQSPLIAMYQDLREFHIKDPQGKVVAMSDLQRNIMDDPTVLRGSTPGFVEGHLIPEISQCIASILEAQKTQALTATSANVITFVASIMELTCSDDPVTDSASVFAHYVKPLIFESFKSPDRQLRFLLLVYFANYLEKLTNNEVSDRIFPHFVQGLADSDATMRIETLKKIPDVTPLITERQLNNDLLRHLAKTQVDADVEIRTWTILTISGLSKKLSSSNNRSGILATAFTKSLKDPHVKPKLAALYGLETSLELFDVTTIANKILTVIAPGLLDSNGQVRRKAKNLFRLYLSKLEGEADQIPADDSEEVEVDFDASLREENGQVIQQFMSNLKLSTPPIMSQPQTHDLAENTGDDEWAQNNDEWAQNNDEWDDDEGWEGDLVDDIDAGLSKPTQETKGGHQAKVHIGQVKIQKSWNKDIENDDWDSWDQPADLSTKAVSKTSKPRTSKVTAKRTIIKASRQKKDQKPNPIAEKAEIFEGFENDGDDGWGDDW